MNMEKTSWVEKIKESIPDHAKDIKLNLDSLINRSPLDPVDTHAIALTAAIASGNGELAVEIEYGSILFESEKERTAAKTAAALMAMTNTYYPFVEMAQDPALKQAPAGLRMNAYATLTNADPEQVSKKQFEMYALAASIVGKCNHCVKSHYDLLKAEGMTVQELQTIGRISSVVSAIGKIAI